MGFPATHAWFRWQETPVAILPLIQEAILLLTPEGIRPPTYLLL